MEKLQGRYSSTPHEADTFYAFLTMNYPQTYTIKQSQMGEQ